MQVLKCQPSEQKVCLTWILSGFEDNKKKDQTDSKNKAEKKTYVTQYLLMCCKISNNNLRLWKQNVRRRYTVETLHRWAIMMSRRYIVTHSCGSTLSSTGKQKPCQGVQSGLEHGFLSLDPPGRFIIYSQIEMLLKPLVSDACWVPVWNLFWICLVATGNYTGTITSRDWLVMNRCYWPCFTYCTLLDT